MSICSGRRVVRLHRGGWLQPCYLKCRWIIWSPRVQGLHCPGSPAKGCTSRHCRRKLCLLWMLHNLCSSNTKCSKIFAMCPWSACFKIFSFHLLFLLHRSHFVFAHHLQVFSVFALQSTCRPCLRHETQHRCFNPSELASSRCHPTLLNAKWKDESKHERKTCARQSRKKSLFSFRWSSQFSMLFLFSVDILISFVEILHFVHFVVSCLFQPFVTCSSRSSSSCERSLIDAHCAE